MTDDQHGEGTAPHSGGRWDPLPQGDYDDGATAFVKLPEGGIDALLASDSPLAAPGHGYVPPQITVTPGGAAGTDPAATGTWAAAPVGGAQWPDPNAVPQDGHAGQGGHGAGNDQFTYHPGATGQWTFQDAAESAPAPGHDVTGQWSIPVAGGDLPDESGEFTTSSLVEQWGGTPPATLPGGAPAPWATQAGQPWDPQTPETGPGHAAPVGDGDREAAGGGHGHVAPGGAVGDEAAVDAHAQAPIAAHPGTHAVADAPDHQTADQHAPDADVHARVQADPDEPAPGQPFDAAPASPQAPAAQAHGGAQVLPDGAPVPDAAPAPDGPQVHASEGPPAAAADVFDAFEGAPAAAADAFEGAPAAAADAFEGAPGAVTHASEGAPAAAASQAAPRDGEDAAAPETPEGAQGAAEGAEEASEAGAEHTPADGGDTEPDAEGAPEHAADSGAPAEQSPGLPGEEHPLAGYVLRVNGVDRPVTDAWIGESLLYVLRERLGLAGAKDGCSQGECGACNVQVDGRLVASCLVPAVTAAGSEVRTVEGLAEDGRPSDVQRALARCGAVQCGFCVPGMAMTVHDLLEGNPAPTELETRQALCGNLCRCSGYRGVVDAVKEVVAEREAHAAGDSESDGDEARIPHQAGPGGGGVNPSAFEPRHDQAYGPDGGQA
ncbi:hypothetical protein DI272_31080 [Streptomyces sp. Act143]|uniref:2Fe-2S iron-sulfur cluster-binding protein n=1 Tax=Streptomyces sp. Act143 TaxID=2200760 RepID=UPI000D672660|nr:(2Fe-2S)-binding protein [Streptomyces sp. Act143]PWI18096.1 hypothetical protein DI272_31080 [Streptomyces sp. Act143]